MVGNFDLVYDLAIKYHTNRENVIERIHHVRELKSFLDEHENTGIRFLDKPKI